MITNITIQINDDFTIEAKPCMVKKGIFADIHDFPHRDFEVDCIPYITLEAIKKDEIVNSKYFRALMSGSDDYVIFNENNLGFVLEVKEILYHKKATDNAAVNAYYIENYGREKIMLTAKNKLLTIMMNINKNLGEI